MIGRRASKEKNLLSAKLSHGRLQATETYGSAQFHGAAADQKLPSAGLGVRSLGYLRDLSLAD
jgi:hypothetical protein